MNQFPRKSFLSFFLLSLVFLSSVLLGWAGIAQIRSTQTYMPHEHCYLLNRGLVLLHGMSDLAIGLAYIAISATLVHIVVRARREIPFHWMMLAFAIFIVACGATHLMEVWTLRTPNPPYWLAGEVKLITALASVVTACLLPPLVPRIHEMLQNSRLSATRKRELEEANAKLQALYERVTESDHLKTEFFANVSHELRTPLSLILGPLERLIESGSLPESVSSDLKIVWRNAAVLRRHVDDLLDVSRVEAAKMEVVYQRANLSALVRAVAGLFGGASGEIQLHFDCPEDLIAEFDVRKMERMLSNLIGNAFKFTPPGGEVWIKAAATETTAFVRIEDSGPGVPVQDRESIFDRFSRASTGGNIAGSGLGLAIVKEFAALHGGSVRLEETAKGAVFVLQIPLKAPAAATVIERGGQEFANDLYEDQLILSRNYSALAPPVSRSHGPEARRILLVEDNEEMRRFISDALSAVFAVHEARTATEALAHIRTQPVDLVLTDMMLPGMDGRGLLAAIRAEQAYGNVPVIVLTARSDEALKSELLRSGAQDYITKPFALAELMARIEVHLSAKIARDVLQGALSTREANLGQLAGELAVKSAELEKAKDAAESANRAKDRFLAVLSHELRTPLTPVLAMAATLEEERERLPAILQEAGGVIRRNVELESRLIDDLLDLTRVSTGKLQLQLSILDLHKTIREVVQMCSPAAGRKGIRVHLDLAAGRSYVRGDSARLHQVVWNLLGNAIKFTPAGGEVALKTRNSPAGEILMDVIDSGEGIPPGLLDQIFEPFEQGGSERGLRSGGLGLGLTVVRGVIEAHGGRVRVESRGTGHGADFCVELRTVEQPERMASGEAGTSNGRLHGRVLLVEDNDDTRITLTRLLHRWGFTVHPAANVEDAASAAKTEEFDLLISDIGLPDGTGLDLIRRLDGSVGACIAMSGYGTEEDVRNSLDAGFAKHLIKPISIAQLKDAIQDLGWSASAPDLAGAILPS